MLDTLLVAMIRHPRKIGVLGFIIAAILLSVLWWLVLWNTPERAFNDMLSNNLATTSVTKVASAQAQSQEVTQYARLQLGSENAADWLVVARQVDSSATTESIGTPGAGYIRYTNITPSKQDALKRANFSKILNKWGKSDGSTDPTLVQLFNQTLLDISSAPLPPIANLSEQNRHTILVYLHDEKVFTPDYSTVKRNKFGGRQMFVYNVSVQLSAYVRMMQAFAHMEGIKGLDSVDPNRYDSLPPVMLQFAVDKASHQLEGVTYPSNNFAQRYTDWGLLTPIAIPTKTIPTTDLQGQIQTLQPR